MQMVEEWEGLLAESVPEERRGALRAGFYGADSEQMRHAMLLEFKSYLRQPIRKRERPAGASPDNAAVARRYRSWLLCGVLLLSTTVACALTVFAPRTSTARMGTSPHHDPLEL
ncbi:hypothetical protein T492DRAFT_916579 [Pavlovales sp. CCMP2436]|nr:hypothetical protein T492DRAFT_916579 [Pavlovales sp. CCMP2436]